MSALSCTVWLAVVIIIVVMSIIPSLLWWCAFGPPLCVANFCHRRYVWPDACSHNKTKQNKKINKKGNAEFKQRGNRNHSKGKTQQRIPVASALAAAARMRLSTAAQPVLVLLFADDTEIRARVLISKSQHRKANTTKTNCLWQCVLVCVSAAVHKLELCKAQCWEY